MKNCIVAIFVLLAVIFSGCSHKTDSETAKKSESIAKVGNESITAEDFKNFIKSKPMQSAGKSSNQLIEKYLDDMVTEELLYQEALRLKIDQDPQLKSAIRRMLSQKIIEDQVRNKLWKTDIDQQRLQQYYDQYKDEFNRPEQARLADIFIAIPPDANEEKKAELKKKAELVLAEAKQEIQNRTGLMPLIQKYSDPNNKYSKGNTGFFDIEGNPAGIDKKLAEEAFKLEKIGDLMDHVVETPDGFHIIMLAGKRPAINKSLADVSDLLKQRMRQEEFPKLTKEYIAELKKKMKIQIDQQRVAEIMKNIDELQEKKPQMTRPGTVAAPPSIHDSSVTPPVKIDPPAVPKESGGQVDQPGNMPPVRNEAPTP